MLLNLFPWFNNFFYSPKDVISPNITISKGESTVLKTISRTQQNEFTTAVESTQADLERIFNLGENFGRKGAAPAPLNPQKGAQALGEHLSSQPPPNAPPIIGTGRGLSSLREEEVVRGSSIIIEPKVANLTKGYYVKGTLQVPVGSGASMKKGWSLSIGYDPTTQVKNQPGAGEIRSLAFPEPKKIFESAELTPQPSVSSFPKTPQEFADNFASIGNNSFPPNGSLSFSTFFFPGKILPFCLTAVIIVVGITQPFQQKSSLQRGQLPSGIFLSQIFILSIQLAPKRFLALHKGFLVSILVRSFATKPSANEIEKKYDTILELTASNQMVVRHYTLILFHRILFPFWSLPGLYLLKTIVSRYVMLLEFKTLAIQEGLSLLILVTTGGFLCYSVSSFILFSLEKLMTTCLIFLDQKCFQQKLFYNVESTKNLLAPTSLTPDSALPSNQKTVVELKNEVIVEVLNHFKD